jgi:hypothetical protein
VIPQHLTVDKGSETADMGAFQLALRWIVVCLIYSKNHYSHIYRQQFAPELSLEEFPGFCTLPSTLNIVIEGLWQWLRQECGVNLHTLITDGHKHGIYNVASPLHE